MTLHGYMLAAELQFLNEPHSGCDQALFGPAPRPINAIFLLGPMAALASLWKPGPWLRGARLIIFIDNDDALRAPIRGDSRATMARWIAQECWGLLAYSSALAWFDGARSCSNPADAPPRGLPLTMPPGMAVSWALGELNVPRS